MAPAEKRDWGEWGRFTMTALGSSAITLVITAFWLGQMSSEIHASTGINLQQDERIERLSDISADLKNLIITLNGKVATSESEIRRLRDLTGK